MLTAVLFLAMAGAQAEAAPTATAQADPSPSPDRITCRSRPVLGSRIARQRICKTEEEWRIYDADLEQHRRDTARRGIGCRPDSQSAGRC